MAEATQQSETKESLNAPPPKRSPSPPGSPNFSGRWRLKESINFDPFLQDCNVGYLKRQVVGMVTSEHHITQDGNAMAVEVTATAGKVTKQQEYEIGNKFTEVEINGEEAIVNTEWEGTAISEHHKTDSFEYKMMRVLQDDDTMVLQLQSPKGTKAERIYKKYVL